MANPPRTTVSVVYILLTTLLLYGVLGLVGCSASQNQTAPLQNVATPIGSDYDAGLELALLYAPVFYLHPAEIYQPQPVNAILNQSRLRQSIRFWPDVNILIHPTSLDLFALPGDSSYFLDEWFSDDRSAEFSNYTAHNTYYAATLHPRAGGPQPAVYAHVVRDENSKHITIQYWAFYVYNDWFNKHEGDWEMVQVILSAAGQPEWVVLSQHHGGTRRSWATALVEGGTHPVAHVALGSHANYFVGDEIYPQETRVGNRQVQVMDRTGKSGRLIPQVILIPGRAELAANPGAWPGAEWIMYRGHWGEMSGQSDLSGPLGPADKGQQWEQPYAWGMNQPLDLDTWYRNRLRVTVVGASPGEAQVRLTSEQGQELQHLEELGNLAILHTDPPTNVVASIKVAPHTRWEVISIVPDVETRQVAQLRFPDVQFNESGYAVLELAPGDRARLTMVNTLDWDSLTLQLPMSGTVNLSLQGAKPTFLDRLSLKPSAFLNRLSLKPSTFLDRLPLKPSAVEISKATWDAPDPVWMSNILPADQLGLGVIDAFTFSLAPMLILVGVLYWVNAYKRRPVLMMAAAFMWGAIPAVVVALTAELFFRLPANLLGPHVLEAVRLGLLAPVLEEVLKGVGVIFIYWRYRSKFDDALAGMVYGALVGFGFAVTANLLSYIGSFMLYGYQGVGQALVVERSVHALDHGLYTAILGAGLGFARLAQRGQRWTIAGEAVVLAISTHTAHNLLARSLVGLNVLTVIVTGAGTLVLWAIAGWSLWQRRQCIQSELKDTIPAAIYHTLIKPLAGTRAQWQALRQDGFRAWRQTRRLHRLCGELAFKRMQMRRFPEEPERAAEAEVLMERINVLLNYAGAPQ